MKFGPGFSLIIMLVGYFVGALGMVLQKYAVTGLTAQGKTTSNGWKLKIIWFLGLTCLNLVAVFQFFAVGGLGPQKTGAAMGANVVFILFLSAVLLHERVALSAAFWACVMGGAIAAVNLIPQASAAGFSLPLVFAGSLSPLVFLLPIPYFRKTAQRISIAVLCGAASGALNGFMVIIMKLLNSCVTDSSEYALQGVFSSWIFWLVIFLSCGCTALVLLQVAYAHGPMQASAPYFYGLAVIWPVCWSYAIFAIPFTPLPAVLFAVIALSAIMIQRVSTKHEETNLEKHP